MKIILLYHAILKNGRQALTSVDPYYAISADNFARQMEYLNAAKKETVLTFDDGLKSHCDAVKPVLEKYGFTGHFFITVENIGKAGYMSWEDVIDLKRAGHIIGSHGMTHRILTTLDKKTTIKELKDSRLAISKMVDGKVDYFSVPGGFYSPEIRKIAKDLGYKAVFTSEIGVNRDTSSAYDLKRIPIKRDTSIGKFKSIIETEQIPAADKIEYFSKRTLQKIIGDRKYHRLRKTLLKV